MSHQEREHSLGERRDDEFYTLYVNNLPDELNEVGITQIFQSYGEICALFAPMDANWAYVSYKSYKEAEHAIRSLNHRSPLYLNVAFRKKKLQPVTQKYSSPLVNGAPIEQTDYGYPQNGNFHNVNVQRGAPRTRVFTLPQMPNCDPALDAISVYPTEVDHNVYNPFENTGRYADTNAMWSRGCVNIDDNGKRYVSMGRGYTRYHIPEPAYAQIEQHIGRVYEKRRAGFYQYGDDRLQHEIGKCSYCGHLTKLRCAKCNAFYCSRECQVGDWPRHRNECKIIPALVGEFDAAAAAAYSSAEELIHVTRKPHRGTTELGSLSSLRRPKRVPNMTKMTNSDDVETPKREVTIDQISPEERIKSPRHEDNDGNAVVSGKDVAPSVECSRQPRESSERVKTVESAKQETDRLSKNEPNDVNDRVKDNSEAVSFKPDNDNFQQNSSSLRIKDRPLGGKSSTSTIETARTDYLKLEKDMAFHNDPRAPKNIASQAPVDPSLAVKVPPVVQREVATSVESKKIESVVISRDSFTDVCVVIVLPDKTFWVNKKEDVRKLEAMMTELNEKVENYEKVTDLVVGEIYAVRYETIWHRVSILTTNPIRVLYIDFGNDEPPQSQDFRSLRNFTVYPALAIRVRLSGNSKTVEPEQELSVKMIGLDENGIVEIAVPDAVHKTVSPKAQSRASEVAKEETPKITETRLEDKSSRNLPNVIDGLNVDSEGFVQAYVALDKNSCAVCVLNSEFMEHYKLIFETITEFCEAVNKPTNFSPKVGDFVCGKRDDIWVRGHVLSLGPPVRLALVDEARVAPVERVIEMPSEYEKICSFGSICTFQDAASNLGVNETGQFRITKVVNEAGDRILKGTLLSPDNLKNARFTLKNWTPTPEQKGIRYAELRSNTEVCISAYSSERFMYVRSLDNASLETFHRVIQNVAKWAQKAPKLDETPVIGQLVIAKFVDGNYYRAVVTKLLDGKIGVSYVDYGNSELTTIDQLRLLSDELKEQTSCASKIILKGVKVDVAPTKEVHRYLDLLVGTEQPLICTFEGIPSKDGVTLKTATGECVNDKVNAYLTPAWQREDPSKNLECFMVDNLETATLGEIGHTVKALPLFATDPPFKYVMAPFDKELLTHITGIMPGLIQKYCESTKEHYIPRINELCLAVWEGGWYRGACINRNETPTRALIYFVDFGNMAIVDHTDIRQMTEDFVSPGGLGLSCIVKNLGIQLVNGKVPENIQRRVEELVPLNDLIDVKIIKKSTPENNIEGDYEIELPTVREKLVAEGLAKP